MPKTKKKQIAYCGINCLECDAYIATKNNDDKLRKETAEKWSQKYGFTFKPENLNCDGGCTNPDRKIMIYCRACPIRGCAQVKGVINCAYCNDYSCDKTDQFLKSLPQAKKTLDAIKQGMH